MAMLGGKSEKKDERKIAKDYNRHFKTGILIATGLWVSPYIAPFVSPYVTPIFDKISNFLFFGSN